MSPSVAPHLTNTPAHTHHPLRRLGSNTHHPNRPPPRGASPIRRTPDVPLSPRPLALELELELCLPPCHFVRSPPLPSLARAVVLCRPVPSSSPLAPLQTRRLPSRAHAALPPGILSLRVVVFVSGSWWSVVSRRRFPSSAAASRSTCRTRDPRDEDTRRAGDGAGLPDCSRGARRGRLRVAVIFTVAGGPRANSFRGQRASRGRTAFRF